MYIGKHGQRGTIPVWLDGFQPETSVQKGLLLNKEIPTVSS